MRILTIDIETSPHLSAHFGRKRVFINPEATLEESTIITFAAKWHDKKQVIYHDIWTTQIDKFYSILWNLLDEADLVVGYNSRKFDIKRINAELLERGYTPPSPYHQVDLFQQALKHFNFSSYKLKHLLKRLGLSPKLEENVDMQLWIDACFKKDKKAQTLMKRYNIQDVKSTEEFYDYMLGWIKPHLNWGLFIDDESDDPVCPNCGSRNLIKKGVEHTKVKTYQRWKCKDCGSHHRGRRSIGKPGVDNGILA
jgi:DNA polymerase elongation subunit (family B)/predicted nucleic-acid-binding Zn-ribbon protein